jgi:uncharacterized membrane protein
MEPVGNLEGGDMRRTLQALGKTLLSGLLITFPVYIAVLLMLKAMKSVAGLVRPFALLLPDSWPAESLLGLLLVLLCCFGVGAVVRTAVGRVARERAERTLFERIPGYALIRSLTQQMAGQSSGNVWKPALAEFDDGLVPAFIIEESDGQGPCTVFVPSIPTPLAGAGYLLEPRRVHPVDVPFTAALRVVSHWGAGAKRLVEGIDRETAARFAASHVRAGTPGARG